MKNYKKIPFNRIKNIESYVEKKIKAGHIIIQIMVNEDHKEIEELVSYANDKECKSYFRSLADSDEQLKSCVINEDMNLYYAFKDKNRDSNIHTDDIDIEVDMQDIIDFHTFKKNFKDMDRVYSGESFQYDGEIKHYEFFISTGKGDIENFGGLMEVEFATEWMTEHGYYSK